MSSAKRHVLIYGANGALGRSIVAHFKAKNWTITSLDFTANAEAHFDIQLPKGGLVAKDAFASIKDKMSDILVNKNSGGSGRLDAIINVAGGWTGGSVADDALFDNVSMMMGQSLDTSLIAAKLAALYLDKNGLLVLTGAAAALGPTSGMVAYGLAKAAVHHLVKSIGTDPSASGMAEGVRVVGICPIMLDTPMNRKYMAEGTDTSTWTPLDRIASELMDWTLPTASVKSGHLYKIETIGGATKFVQAE